VTKENLPKLMVVTERKPNERYIEPMTNTNPLSNLTQSFALKANTLASSLDPRGVGRIVPAALPSQGQLNFRASI
jgi:hypothetical protein